MQPGLPGRIIILPSTFNGSPRAMQQNYQDAMAIVSKFGKPNLFLTFTCNPKCQAITENQPGAGESEAVWLWSGRYYH